MKKLKKSSKSRKSVIVFIYGSPAVGKYTTAQRLANMTGFKILHNHAVRDLIFGFFDRENIAGQRIWEFFYFEMTKKIIKEHVNTIFTYGHSRNRIYCSGLSSLKFVATIAEIVKKNGGVFYPVQLVCDDQELFKRVRQPSRKKFQNQHTVRDLKKLIKIRDFKTPINMKTNFTINNTRISAKRTAKIIKDHFNL